MRADLRSAILARGRGRLSAAKRVLIIGDSQAAGRGTGTGSVAMDGARALSWPSKLVEALVANGDAASAHSFAQAANTGGTLAAYDPRIIQGSWSVAGGLGNAGYLMSRGAVGGTALRFTPAEPVDTFEIWTPCATYPTLNYSLDGGAVTGISETGTETFLKTAVVTTLGDHYIEFALASGTATVFLNTVIAYNSAARDFRVMNMAARGWSTTDWLVQDRAWRAFPSISALLPDITLISLGVNDFRTSGPLNSLATFAANMQTIITKAMSGGGKVGLVLPMPVNTANEGSFTQADMLATYQSLAASNGLPLYRTDQLLGTWAAANTAGLVSDDLHWKAPASASLGAALVPFVRRIAGLG